jgi:hypothetical protein
MLIRQVNKKDEKVEREKGEMVIKIDKGIKERNSIHHHHTTIEELLEAVFSMRSIT